VHPPMSRTRNPAETDPPPANRKPAVASRRGPRPTSDRPPAHTYLEVRLENARPVRRALTESPLVLGRVPDVGLVLDHHTVSRRHAEMICDLYGRWWIRDLGSTNGTTIDGRPIAEHLLSPGDVIGVGDYTLTFMMEAPVEDREAFDVGTPEDDQPTLIRKLIDLEPPRIAAGHLRTLLELSRRLIALCDPGERRGALCDLVVRADFHAVEAVVIRAESRRNYRALSRVHRAGDPRDPEAPGGDDGGRSRASPDEALDEETPRPFDELGQSRAGRGPVTAGSPAGGPIAVGRKPYISRNVLDALLEMREPVIAGNGTGNGFPAIEMSIARHEMEVWALAVPLRSGTDSMDVLYATVPQDCATSEWLKLYELAGEVYKQGETVWAARRHAQENAAIEHELDTARQIQLRLVPGPYSAPGLDVNVGFEPCRWVGGDYVDVVPLPDGRVLLAIADVCGKGLHAAMVGSSLHTMVRAAADANPPLSRLVERVNRHLCEWLPESSFVTMVAVTIDPRTGEIDCVNAGHPPAFVVSAEGRLTELQSAENPALGIALAAMASQHARLSPGDVVAMYTDGITELTNPDGEMLGVSRLGAELCAIRAGTTGGVGAMCAALIERLDAFRRGEHPGDDCTFLLAQRR
jgi:phosphoserine phosphatase RsbU/P